MENDSSLWKSTAYVTIFLDPYVSHKHLWKGRQIMFQRHLKDWG